MLNRSISRWRAAFSMLCAWSCIQIGPAWALDFEGQAATDLARFQDLLEVAKLRDAHEIELPVAGGNLEVTVRAGKVSDQDCHYYETLRKRSGRQPATLRIWRSAHALPCARLADDLRANLTTFDIEPSGLVRTAISPVSADGQAGSAHVALTAGARIRSEPSLQSRILKVRPTRSEAEVGPLTAGDWHPVLEHGRVIGYVHRAVVERLSSG